MAHSKDYLPTTELELVDWSGNFTNVVLDNAAAWGITEKEQLDLKNAYLNFKFLQIQSSTPEKSKITVQEKNTAKQILKSKIRELVNYRLRNPVITNAQRVSMGLRARKFYRTPIPVPSSHPKFVINVLDVRRLMLSFSESGVAGKAKPYGIDGAVIMFAVLDKPPNGVEELIHSVLATRTPHIFQFNDNERGKYAYFAICWQNEKGEKGPISGIEKAIVP
ncbi:MAG: hypothetical protein LBC74_11470 [Planctomycetaceae bacterium]|jgi:hypothetical protein|nr:hypothetical protein [Planctomycetaceae bacterium]